MNSALNLERTLAIIKPHAFQHYSSICRRIRLAGFHILQDICVKLSAEQAEKFLRCRQQNEMSTEQISMEIKELCSGPLIALCLSRENAIALWMNLMGPDDCSVARKKAPTTLRALYGDDNGNVIRNAVYGSKCANDASNDLHFFFSNLIPESICNDVDDIYGYLCKNIMIKLTDALYELLRVRPVEPLEWIAKYVLDNNVNQPFVQSPCPEVYQLIEEMKLNEANQEAYKKGLSVGKLNCGCSMESENSFGSL